MGPRLRGDDGLLLTYRCRNGITSKVFNALGDVLVAPITQGGDYSRYAGFAVSLTGTGCKTQGVAWINKIRMLDLAARKARKIERVPLVVIEDALERLGALGSGAV